MSVKEKLPFTIAFINMHDGKFFFTMLQCLAWSQLIAPFCGCDCRCGQGSIPGHTCIMFTKDSYNELRQKSEEKMKHQVIIAAVRRSGAYTKIDHRDWVDEFNKGVSHLGIPPTNWSISSLAFDMFHGQMNYVKH